MEVKDILTINLDMIQTLGLSVLVLLFGRYLVKSISILNNFCIPSPVIGGLVFALITLIGYETGTFMINLDDVLRNFFMIAFFTTVGFGASLNVLKKGGIAVAIFLFIASILCIIQNIVGIGIATAFGENPLLGLLAGSISLTGGHGTAGAFGPFIEESYNMIGASTVGITSATFGLIAGSIIGGPIAKKLIESKNLLANSKNKEHEIDNSSLNNENTILNNKYLSNAFFQISIAVGLGSVVSILIKEIGITIPAYIGSMLVAAAMRNILKDGSKHNIRIREISALGEIFLAIFLSQALMSLKLWELVNLAIPLLTILCIQILIMYLFAYFITFKVMGGDYDASVLAAGHCGFGMGATPNAVANMTEVVNKYGPSPKAFFVLPLTGGLFIDFVNAFIITTFINLLI